MSKKGKIGKIDFLVEIRVGGNMCKIGITEVGFYWTFLLNFAVIIAKVGLKKNTMDTNCKQNFSPSYIHPGSKFSDRNSEY